MRMAIPETDPTATCEALTQTPGVTASVDLGLWSPSADRHPVLIYLASLAPGPRRTMQQALHVIANLLAAGTTA